MGTNDIPLRTYLASNLRVTKPRVVPIYVWAGSGKFIIDHTEVAEAFGGRGRGNQLFLEAVDVAREQQLKILPLCPFARRMFDPYPEFAHVRA